MRLEGVVGNILRHRVLPVRSVTPEHPAAVIPFGQSDMVHTFMEGIAPDVLEKLESEIAELWRGHAGLLLGSIGAMPEPERAELAEKFTRISLAGLERQLLALAKWRERNYEKRSLLTIQSLPKDELATVAESLVSLTSLKRRVSMDYTVGGPVDVCLISKYDGCVWVKKKHYFSADLNPAFFSRYRTNLLDAEENANQTKLKQAERQGKHPQRGAGARRLSLDQRSSGKVLPKPRQRSRRRPSR